MKKTLIYTAAVLLASAVTAQAADTPAVSEEAAYLKIPTSARALAMGSAYTAVADDLGSIGVNPGGIGLIHGGELMATYSKFLPGTGYGHVSAAHFSDKSGGTSAVSMRAFSASGIERTDASGASLGSFSGSGLALEATHARMLSGSVAAGVTARAVRDEIAGDSVWGVAADAGATMPEVVAGRDVRLGVAMRNIGPSLFRKSAAGADTGDASLPATLAVGVAGGFESGIVQLVGDLDFGYAFVTSRAKIGLGVEAVLKKMLAIRVGLRAGSGGYSDSFTSGGVTAGFGVMMQGFRLDYAFAPMAMGTTHFVTLAAGFGLPKQEVRERK